jgi:hypothetical protein
MLRDAGLKVVVNGGGGSFKSQMKKADASGARYALLIGADEAAADAVSVKPLREPGEQKTVPSQRSRPSALRPDNTRDWRWPLTISKNRTSSRPQGMVEAMGKYRRGRHHRAVDRRHRRAGMALVDAAAGSASRRALTTRDRGRCARTMQRRRRTR